VILLDTNVLIHALKGRPEVAGKLKALPAQELAVSSVTRYELEFGVLRSKNPAGRRKTDGTAYWSGRSADCRHRAQSRRRTGHWKYEEVCAREEPALRRLEFPVA
jgi:hypothetical protein